MLVSIVIPTYNCAKYLESCLKSCYNQTYKDYEIIVVDDNSSDDTYNILKKHNIRYVKNDKNLGPAASRNIGISLAKGDLVSFIDSDDLMHIDKLAKSVKEFGKDIGMTCGNYQIIYDRVRLFNPFYSSPINIDYKLLMQQNFVASGSTTVRKSILDELGGFNEEYWIAEDYDLWLRISEKYKIKYIHNILYYYSIMRNSNSLTQRDDIQIRHISNLKKIKDASRKRMKYAKHSE